MADPAPYPETGVEPDLDATTGTTRWQKAVGTIGLVVILALGVLIFGIDRGNHVPSDQAPGGNQEQQVGTEDAGGHDRRDH